MVFFTSFSCFLSFAWPVHKPVKYIYHILSFGITNKINNYKLKFETETN